MRGRVYDPPHSVWVKPFSASSHLNNRIKLVVLRNGTNLRYIHQDSLGSTSVVTDSAGAQYGYTRYYPYGLTRTSSGSFDTSEKFTGQRLDGTGLYYYGARYYDPNIGRFISADTVVPNPANPQSLNRYSYCYNNPLHYNDPSGHDPNDATTMVTIPGIMGQMSLQTAQACGFTNYSIVGAPTPPPAIPTPPPVTVTVPPSMMVQVPQPALPSVNLGNVPPTQNQGPTLNAAPQTDSQANAQEPEPKHSAVENFIYKAEICVGTIGLGYYGASVVLSGFGAPATALALSPLAVASWEVLALGLNSDYGEEVVPSLHGWPEVIEIPMKGLGYIWSIMP